MSRSVADVQPAERFVYHGHLQARLVLRARRMGISRTALVFLPCLSTANIPVTVSPPEGVPVVALSHRCVFNVAHFSYIDDRQRSQLSERWRPW